MIKEGIVRWWSRRLGYGFVTNPEGQDVFVTYKVVPGKPGYKNLQDNDVVTYVEAERDRGLYATEVLTVKRGQNVDV